MAKAIWNDTVIAESSGCIVVESNYYFPADSLRWEYLRPSPRTTYCAWKGTATYYDVEINGNRNPAAAWSYPDPMPAAEAIRGRVAFWQGVRVEPDPDDSRSLGPPGAFC